MVIMENISFNDPVKKQQNAVRIPFPLKITHIDVLVGARGLLVSFSQCWKERSEVVLLLVKLESVCFFFLLNSHLYLHLPCFILLVTFLNRKNTKLFLMQK